MPDQKSIQPKPGISVIILTWNRKADVLEMLESLEKQTFRDFEVVVIDQASVDGTSEAIVERFPHVRIMTLRENLGVPGGRNVGVSLACGEILFFLDDDATLDVRSLENAWNEFDRHPDVGIVTGRVADYYTGEMQRAYWVYPDYQLPQSENRFETFTFSGGVHAIRKSVLEVTGLYDDLIVFGPEEYGLSLRCFAAGYKIVYNPAIVLRHKGRHRLGWDADRWQLYLRGRLFVALFYCPLPELLPILFEYLVGHLIQAIRNGFVQAYLGALMSVIQQWSAVLAHRRPLNRRSFQAFRELERRQRGPLAYRIQHELFRLRRVVNQVCSS